jgi:CHASE1-domain containing sensor protein
MIFVTALLIIAVLLLTLILVGIANANNQRDRQHHELVAMFNDLATMIGDFMDQSQK